jgi:hypothetical protein
MCVLCGRGLLLRDLHLGERRVDLSLRVRDLLCRLVGELARRPCGACSYRPGTNAAGMMHMIATMPVDPDER